METVLKALESQGVLGLVVCVLIYAVISLWKDLKAEHQARLTEAKETTRQLLELTEKVHEALENIEKIASRTKPRE